MKRNQPLKAADQAQAFLPYGRQHIDDDDIKAVQAVLTEDFLTTGPHVAQFEKALCEATDAEHGVVVGNGTHALHLACMEANLQPGSYAIVPTITFLATANAVRYCGADVLFCDVDPQTGLMRPQDLQAVLDQNPGRDIRAVLPVHIAGQSVDLPGIKAIADHYGLKVIADSCHALGTIYKGEKSGSCKFEDLATFSFHPVKTIATGEGGAITTNNAESAARMRRLRAHGMAHKPEQGLWVYDMPELGFNYRLSDIHCALGVSQMKKLSRFIEIRRQLAAYYDELMPHLAPLVMPPHKVEGCTQAWHLYAPRFDFKAIGKDRNTVMQELKAQGIGTQVHYIPVHTQPYYQGLYGKQDLPGAQSYYAGTLSLPLFTRMEKTDVERVVETLKTVVNAA